MFFNKNDTSVTTVPNKSKITLNFFKSHTDGDYNSSWFASYMQQSNASLACVSYFYYYFNGISDAPTTNSNNFQPIQGKYLKNKFETWNYRKSCQAAKKLYNFFRIWFRRFFCWFFVFVFLLFSLFCSFIVGTRRTTKRCCLSLWANISKKREVLQLSA